MTKREREPVTGPRYELRISGSAAVEKAVWHHHGDQGAHFHTAEDYRRHEPVDDEVFVAVPEED